MGNLKTVDTINKIQEISKTNTELAFEILNADLAKSNFDRMTSLKVEEIICTTALTAHI